MTCHSRHVMSHLWLEIVCILKFSNKVSNINWRDWTSLRNKAPLQVLHSVRFPQVGKKMVVFELRHPLYLRLHVHVCAAWKGHWLCYYVCHVLQQTIHVETFGWLGSREWSEKCENDGCALRIMRRASTWARRSLGKSVMQILSLPWFKILGKIF